MEKFLDAEENFICFKHPNSFFFKIIQMFFGQLKNFFLYLNVVLKLG